MADGPPTPDLPLPDEYVAWIVHAALEVEAAELHRFRVLHAWRGNEAAVPTDALTASRVRCEVALALLSRAVDRYCRATGVALPTAADIELPDGHRPTEF